MIGDLLFWLTFLGVQLCMIARVDLTIPFVLICIACFIAGWITGRWYCNYVKG
jgi:hypothetical protein